MSIEVDRRSRLFVPAFIVGWAVIIYGAMTALDNARDAHPFALAVHVVTFDIGHDLLLVPTALAIGWLVGKAVPAVARGPVRAALAVSAMFSLFAYPLIRRWGRRPTNSSTLPLDYGRNLIIVLVLVWFVALATIVRRTRQLRRSRAHVPIDSAVGSVELLEGPDEEVDHVAGRASTRSSSM